MADISLNELTGIPVETIATAPEQYWFLFGYDGQDPVFRIQPEGIAQTVVFGYPSLAIPGLGVVTPDGISEKVLFGEPALSPKNTVFPEGISEKVLFGEPNLVSTPRDSVYPEGLSEKVLFGEPLLSNPPVTPVDPTVTVLSPSGGGSIGTQSPWVARLELAALDGTVQRIFIAVSYPSGSYETAYINGVFAPDYSGVSSLVQTSPGVFDISLLRNAGWPGSPRIFLHANTNRGGMTES